MNFIKSDIVAKGIKKAMKVYGVAVLRCASNRNGGVLITVKGDIENQKKAIKFFKEFELGLTPNKAQTLRNECEYVDYGNMYHYVKA